LAEARIIDGTAFAAALRARINRQVGVLKRDRGITPGLAMILVGGDEASRIYVRNKDKQAADAGMVSLGETLPADTSQDAVVEVVRRLNEDDVVHGILVQLPLPDHIDAAAVIDAVDPVKDVDGFHPENVGRLMSGRPAMIPCTPMGCMMLIEDTVGDPSGLAAVVIGRSNIVGKPLAQLLLAANCTVTTAHSRTRNLAALAKTADILVAATGRPAMVRGDWIKPGATVIDIGINRVPGEGGKMRLVGDVAFHEAVRIAGAITPVPGGVGPMTIACLLANTLVAACRRNGIEVPPDPGE
jgi:methylenetetrahydrofolate dehydrogenase (NADP+)/methenyltetrahydrofolate cyclohydrolase